MLTGLQVCKQLNVDEFIILCNQMKGDKFEIEKIKRFRDNDLEITCTLADGSTREIYIAWYKKSLA